MCKGFSSEVLKTDFGSQEQSHFLAKTIDFFKENDTVKCKIRIDGRNADERIVSLDKPIKTDVGSELGLRFNRD